MFTLCSFFTILHDDKFFNRKSNDFIITRGVKFAVKFAIKLTGGKISRGYICSCLFLFMLYNYEQSVNPKSNNIKQKMQQLVPFNDDEEKSDIKSGGAK